MLYTVDPKLVIITFGGVPLTGFAKKKINLTKVEDNFKVEVGTNGETVRMKSNNRNWTGTLSFLPGTPTLDYLSTVTLRDEAGNLGVLPFTVKDALGSTKFFSPQAFIVKPADYNTGVEIEQLDWSIYLVDVQYNHGGNVL